MKKQRQFNKKLALNLELQKKKNELEVLQAQYLS